MSSSADPPELASSPTSQGHGGEQVREERIEAAIRAESAHCVHEQERDLGVRDEAGDVRARVVRGERGGACAKARLDERCPACVRRLRGAAELVHVGDEEDEHHVVRRPARDRAGECEQRVEAPLCEADGENGSRGPRRPRLFLHVECRVLAQDGRVQIAERLTRLDPELVDEERARLAVGRQGVRLPSRSVKREHELGARPLTERLPADESLDLGNSLPVTSQREDRIEAILQRCQAELLEARSFNRREGHVTDTAERRPAPERESLVEMHERKLAVPFGQETAPLLRLAFEAVEVDLVSTDLEGVAGRPGHQAIWWERFA